MARVYNCSDKPFAFQANSFLGMAEPAEYVPGTGQEPVEPCLELCSDNVDVTVQTGELTEPRKPEQQPSSVSEAATSLRASTILARRLWPTLPCPQHLRQLTVRTITRRTT